MKEPIQHLNITHLDNICHIVKILHYVKVFETLVKREGEPCRVINSIEQEFIHTLRPQILELSLVENTYGVNDI